MRIEVLEYLIEVDKEQSFSKAAQNLYISKSTLSESISQLERELNVCIFERLKKGIATTEAGWQIINQAKIVLSETAKLYEISLNSPPLVEYNETIKFGLTEKFAKAGLGTCLSIAMQKNPKLNLHSALMNYTTCIDSIIKSEIDFAIIGYSHELKNELQKFFNAHSIKFINLSDDPVVCLVNKNSAVAQKTGLLQKDLSNFTLITYSNIVPDEVFIHHKSVFLAELDNIFQLVSDNIGISPLPYSLIKNSSISQWDNIALLPLNDSLQHNCIIYSSLKPLTAAQKSFIDLYKYIFNKNFT